MYRPILRALRRRRARQGRTRYGNESPWLPNRARWAAHSREAVIGHIFLPALSVGVRLIQLDAWQNLNYACEQRCGRHRPRPQHYDISQHHTRTFRFAGALRTRRSSPSGNRRRDSINPERWKVHRTAGDCLRSNLTSLRSALCAADVYLSAGIHAGAACPGTPIID